MLQIFTGGGLLLFTIALVLKYRPRSFASWYVCLLCCSMGVMAMVTGGGVWQAQLLQLVAQLILAVCALFHLHREKVFARHRAKARKQQRQMQSAVQSPTCVAVASMQKSAEVKRCA